MKDTNGKKEDRVERSFMKDGVKGEGCLGLHFVNPAGDTFFLFASQILAMWKSPEYCILIKSRDLDGKSASGYPVGQVVGAMDIDGSDARVMLFLGSAGADIESDNIDKGLKNVESSQVYSLPLEEVDTCIAFFELMSVNQQKFDEMMRGRRPSLPFGR